MLNDTALVPIDSGDQTQRFSVQAFPDTNGHIKRSFTLFPLPGNHSPEGATGIADFY